MYGQRLCTLYKVPITLCGLKGNCGLPTYLPKVSRHKIAMNEITNGYAFKVRTIITIASFHNMTNSDCISIKNTQCDHYSMLNHIPRDCVQH